MIPYSVYIGSLLGLEHSEKSSQTGALTLQVVNKHIRLFHSLDV